MKTLKLRTPGKINLRLDVYQKRPDGFHDIRMLNSNVSIYDELEVDLTERGIEVECENDPTVPSGEGNIVYAACKEIMAYSNKNIGVSVKIKKNIPSAAGMGGGASNAAAILLGLNQLLKIHLPKDKLINIGLRFGADIPFFLYGSPAIATGIGEHLMKIKKLPKMHMVIVAPHIGVSTKSVYEKYNPRESNKNNNVDLPLEFTTKKVVVKYLNNDLETVTAKQYPIIAEIKELLMRQGALASQMTGSGPCVFAIFDTKEKADKAQKKLLAKGDSKWRVFVAENI